MIPRMLDDAFKIVIDGVFKMKEEKEGKKYFPLDGYDDKEILWEELKYLSNPLWIIFILNYHSLIVRNIFIYKIFYTFWEMIGNDQLSEEAVELQNLFTDLDSEGKGYLTME